MKTDISHLMTLTKIMPFLENELSLKGSSEQLANQANFGCSFSNSAGNLVNIAKFASGQDPLFKEAIVSMPLSIKYVSGVI